MLFILASVGIHAGFVITLYSSKFTLPHDTGSVIAVHIRNEPLKKNITTERQQTKTPSTLKSVAKKTPINKFKNKTQPPATQSTVVNITPKESKTRVASILYKNLKQHFNYPRIAIKRNWQGKVLLSLRVTASGKIENIQLSTSSGYDILDRAAIKSLSKIEFVPEMESWLAFDIDLTLPVIYQLTKG